MSNTSAVESYDTDENGAVKVIRIISIIGVIAAFIALFILTLPKSENLSDIWDERTIIGDKNAKNHYVMFTDVMCPYCDYFSRAAMSEEEKFEQYMKDNDIAFEVRVTDYLNEYGTGTLKYSEQSAEAVYCATEQDRFWDYYHGLLTALNDDYHSKGIGNAKGAPMITDITDEYWFKVADKLDLNMDEFKSCYNDHKMLEKVQDNTRKTAKVMQKDGQGGMPYFKFNSFTTTGFDSSWDYSYVERYLDAGLKKN